jgi:putative flippase GtrA
VRFARFQVVGLAGIGVQLGVIALLTSAARWHYLAATGAGVALAVLHNFGWHLAWTWRDRPAARRAWPRTLVRFALANGAVSLVGNLLAMTLLVGLVGLPAVPASVAAIAACGLVNYWISDRRVFV